MKHRATKHWLLIAAATLASPASAQHHPSPKPGLTTVAPSAREAAASIDAFHAALGKGDQVAAAALIAVNALIYESGGVERSKAEYVSHHLPADAAFAKATTRTVLRQVGHASGDFAWIATESTTKGSYRERAINSVSTETMVLRREKGRWRIAHIHWSSANVK